MRRPVVESSRACRAPALSSSSPAAGGPFAARLEWLRDAGRVGLIRNGLRGVEKESLRVDSSGALSQRPHPPSFGAALTHPYITTDYSEALPELVTPPQRTQWETLQFLCDVHAFIQRRLDGELLWPASMPCDLPPDDEIPIAYYGPSNVGRMKTVYRRGLGHRYGRAMQAIAGVHFNYSLPAAFWPEYQAHARARGLADGVPLGRAHGARPQLPARGVARDVPVRRFAGAVPFVPAERPRAAHRARSCDVVRAVRNVVAHERLGLSKQDPRALEHSRQLARRVRGRHARRRDDARSRATRRSASSSTATIGSSTRTSCRSRTSTTARFVRSRARRASIGRSLRSARPASTTSRCARST